MSKSPFLLPAFLCCLFWGSFVYAQAVVASVEIVPGTPTIAMVQGRYQSAANQRELRFLTAYGQSSDLDKRISDVELRGSDGRTIASHRISAGRYIAESDFQTWSYKLDISASKQVSGSAHVTWADSSGALIAFRDLFPEGLGSARVSIVVPDGWKVLSSIRASAENVFDINDVDSAVFHAGPSFRMRKIRLTTDEMEVAVTGQWLFSDDEAVDMAGSIFESYRNVFSSGPNVKPLIVIRPFPGQNPHGQWEADSRGSNITILSSDMPFKNQSLQRLHEQLRHEIFHLWIPNGISLTGNYDWFYEGFALYSSLKTGVAVNRLRFDDFLDTLSRAYAISNSGSGHRSLMQESQDRWSGSNTQVYARGMLIAFACDLAMLSGSRGKRSIADVLKSVFANYHNSDPHEANGAIMHILNTHKELRPIVDRDIQGAGRLDLADTLKGSGLRLSTGERVPQIKVVDRPSGSEKQVLDRLGYNNWRKLPRNNK